MKILVISDTHGNLVAVRHVLDFAKAQNIEAVIHCGDWCDAQSVKTVLEYGLPLYAVMGNCDEAHRNEVSLALDSGSSEISTFAEASVDRHFAPDVWEGELGGRKIAIAHQPWKLDEHRVSGKFDALFYGHFHHQAGSKMYGKTLVVNPGALGNTPKPSFAVYDTETNTATIIDIPT